LQGALGAVFILLRLLGGNVALALLRGDLRLDFDQRILGLRDAVVEFAHDLASVPRRVLHGVGGVVQQALDGARDGIQKRHEFPPEIKSAAKQQRSMNIL
jgi:hypothetical protein